MIKRAVLTIKTVLPRKGFARGVSVLVGGTAGSQVLIMLAAPLLTRLYTPEDFGLLAVFSSLLAMVSVISCFHYELAIPLPESEEDAADVAMLSLICVGFNTLVLGLLVYVLNQAIADLFGVPVLAKYLWLLPLGFLFSCTYKVFNYWSIRTKRFGSIAGAKLTQALTAIIVQVSGFKFGGISLLIANITGQSVGLVSLSRPFLDIWKKRTLRSGRILRVAHRYRRFPLFSSFAGLANTAGMQLPPLMLAASFGPGPAGIYVLAQRVLNVPMRLLGQALGQVFFAHAAESKRNGSLGPLVANLHGKMAHVGMPPILVLIVLGPDIFSVAFGEEWYQAGIIAQWMAPWLYFVFVLSPLSTVFMVAEKQRQNLAFQVVLLSSRVAAISIGASLEDFIFTVILFTIVSAMCWLGFFFWLTYAVGNSVREMGQPIVLAMGFSIVAISPILICRSQVEVVPVVWAAATLLSTSLILWKYWKIFKGVY